MLDIHSLFAAPESKTLEFKRNPTISEIDFETLGGGCRYGGRDSDHWQESGREAGVVLWHLI